MTKAEERDSIPVENKVAKCLVVGDSVRNVGLGHSDIKVECFPGIKTVQLHKVLTQYRYLALDEIPTGNKPDRPTVYSN
jgi:hypothetical protein